MASLTVNFCIKAVVPATQPFQADGREHLSTETPCNGFKYSLPNSGGLRSFIGAEVDRKGAAAGGVEGGAAAVLAAGFSGHNGLKWKEGASTIAVADADNARAEGAQVRCCRAL